MPPTMEGSLKQKSKVNGKNTWVKRFYSLEGTVLHVRADTEGSQMRQFSLADAMYARSAKGVMFDIVWRSGGHLWSMLADSLNTKKQWIGSINSAIGFEGTPPSRQFSPSSSAFTSPSITPTGKWEGRLADRQP